MRTTTTLLAALFVIAAHAQTITTWTTQDGLPSNDLRDVAIGPDGKVWIATSQGVAVFDGNSFTVHNTSSHPGLADNDTYAVEVVSNGTAWVGTDFGLSFFDSGVYQTYTTANGLGGNEVKDVKVAPNGDVWIATSNGASRFIGGGFTAFGPPDIPFGGARHVAFSGTDVLISSGLGGMIVYNGTGFTAVTTAQGLLSNRLRAIAVDGQQHRWVATDEGISLLNSANVHVADHAHVFLLPPPDELNPITDVDIDGQGRIWAGVYVDYLVTEGGVSWFNGVAWTQIETSDGLAGPNVRRLAIDQDDDVWVATSTGLSRISGVGIGMDELAELHAFQLYPNPANHQVVVQADGLRGQWAAWHDASGRLLGNALLASDRQAIDVSGLPDGLYVMRVGGAVRRFVVNH